MDAGSEGLERFAREHHVHYEVEPEALVQGEGREVVALDVRLFATHGESTLQAPGCPRCVELLRDLRGFAEQLLSETHAAHRAEIVDAPRAIYQSREAPGADEVTLALRIRCESAEHRRGGAAGDACFADVRERLESAGVPRR